MIGYPEETKKMLEETREIMKTLPIDQPRIAFITPFPGTPFYKENKTSLDVNCLKNFTGDKPIVKNKNISPREYIRFRDEMIRDFYNSEEYLKHVLDKCHRFPHLKESFDFFFKFLVAKHIVTDATYDAFKEV